MKFGNCRYCRFRITFEVKYGKDFKHWGEEHGYKYICQRFPPQAVSYSDPFNNEVLVKPSNGCYEYQPQKRL